MSGNFDGPSFSRPTFSVNPTLTHWKRCTAKNSIPCDYVLRNCDTSYVLPQCSLSVFKRSFINWCLFTLYTVSQKKTSQFNFRHNFAICWDIFTIFEAPCLGLIAGWCNLLHTHHRCEAFTWRDVTHDVSHAVVHSAHWHWISHHLTYGVWTHRTYPADYSFWSIMQDKVYQTRIANIDELKHRLVQMWAELDHRHIAAAIGQPVHGLNVCDSCVKAQRDILIKICVEFTCSLLVCLLSAWPM